MPLAERRHDEPEAIQKLLFVCSQNKLRSLTAEKLFERFPPYQVRSVGTQPGARIVITEGHIGWADLIFVMEKSHLNRIRRKFPEALEGKRVITLFIPDDYDFMQPELIEELRAKLAPYLVLPAEPDADV
ncbi:MAG TPA: protein-tyrosine-phosphatase [Chthoniobacteraceae bacterium]